MTVIDPATIQPGDGPLVRRAWSVTVKRSLTNGVGGQPGYIRTLSDYDCGQRRLRWRSFTAYSRYGSAVMTKANDNLGWGDPEGEGRIALRVVCDGAASDAAMTAPSIAQLVLQLMATWASDHPIPSISHGGPAKTVVGPRPSAR